MEELLDAGIDVWSTMNVQHLESLNDIVSGITGIRVWETVPDRVFDEADEVVVVDLPPDELLQRLKAGKVYLPQQAERAAANFFRKGNLLALRELALRRTADRVDDEMQAYRRQSAVQSVWPNREALLACVGPGEHGEKVVRSCARLAAQLDVPWHAVHVETPALQRLPEARRQQALRVLQAGAGARRHHRHAVGARRGRGAGALCARAQPVARWWSAARERRWPWQRVAGRPHRRAGRRPRRAAGGAAARPRAPAPPAAARPSRVGAGWPWRGYVAAAAACALIAAGCRRRCSTCSS